MNRIIKTLCILLITVQLVHSSAVYVPANGPIYVDANAPQPAALPTEQPEKLVEVTTSFNYETQTVYGFLDFTTTIGNTVMVFSPNSAPPSEPPKTSAPVVNDVITTKPTVNSNSVEATTEKLEIKPSKTIIKNTEEQKKSPVVSSIVQVVAESAPIEKKPEQSKKPIVSSHVEVVTSNPSSIVVEPKKEVHSKVEVIVDKKQNVEIVTEVKPSKILSSHVEVKAEEPKSIVAPVVSSVVEVHSSSEEDTTDEEGIDGSEEDDEVPVLQVENSLGEPEYDLLSRQPSEYVDETFRVVNLRPSQTPKQPRHRANGRAKTSKPESIRPTGLVTKLGGTEVKDGTTTVHETSVIGTYISGKYAQILQSTSHVYQNNNIKVKPTPTQPLRILKTAAPVAPRNKFVPETDALTDEVSGPQPVDDAYSSPHNHIRSSRRPAVVSGNFKNRFRNHNAKIDNDYADSEEAHVSTQSTYAPTGFGNNKKSFRNRPTKPKNSRYNRYSTKSVELTTVSVFSETTTPAFKRSKPSRAYKQGTHSAAYEPSPPRRYYKTAKVQPTAPVEHEHESSTLYKFKLNRTPGRWQYKTTAKPRVTIRKQNLLAEEAASVSPTPQYDNPQVNGNDIQEANARADIIDLDSAGSVNGDVLNDEETGDNGIEKKKFPVETIKVEISTPADFKDTYYEIATIKSPYTFQVGTLKNTRYITVTSTFEKHLEQEQTVQPSLTEPLTENILATTSHIDKEHNLLDSSIATLPPILVSSDVETPPLETLTETFSTTQTMLKTHILPVLREGGNVTSYTLTQTYHITRLVTATKTLPPMEAYHFVPSKALKEFNSKLDEAGSELHLELDFGDDEDEEEGDEQRPQKLPSDLDLSNVGSDFDISEVDKQRIPEAHLRPKKKNHKVTTEAPVLPMTPNLSPEQLQQLALLRLINPAAAAQIPQVITTSKPVIKLETVYESHVIPFFNGVSTSYSTISRPIATVSKTEYEIGTSTLPGLPIPPQINPLFQQHQQQQFQFATAPVVTQTMLTQTQSKVLKLTFGAKTAYTTLFSTTVVPTILTTYITQSIPVQQTAAFPGYFPAPYPPYPYVG